MGKVKDDLTRGRLEIEEVKGNEGLKQNGGENGKQNHCGLDTTGNGGGFGEGERKPERREQ